MRINVRKDVYMQTRVPQDAGEVFEVVDRNRDYLRLWLPWVDDTDSPDVVKRVITSGEKGRESGTELVLGIFKNNRYIGNIGLHDMKKTNNSGMIGYWLAQDEQGSGIMTDCVRALVHYGFSALSLNRIYIHCVDKNLKSRAIPERLGFVLEGILQDEKFLYGEYFNLAVYGMLKRCWINTAHELQLVIPTQEHKQAAWEYR